VAIGSFVEQVNRKYLCCGREILGILLEEISLWLHHFFSFDLCFSGAAAIHSQEELEQIKGEDDHGACDWREVQAWEEDWEWILRGAVSRYILRVLFAKWLRSVNQESIFILFSLAFLGSGVNIQNGEEVGIKLVRAHLLVMCTQFALKYLTQHLSSPESGYVLLNLS